MPSLADLVNYTPKPKTAKNRSLADRIYSQNFEKNDSVLVSSIMHPLTAMGKAADWFQNEVNTAAGFVPTDEANPFYTSDNTRLQSAVNLAGLANVSGMPFAPANNGATLGTILKPINKNMSNNKLTLWHGSPSKFEKFDISNFGTGEGGLNFGVGHHLSDDFDVAQEYSIPTGKGKFGENMNIYRAEINPPETDFIDWNSPIYQQNEQIKNYIKNNETLSEITSMLPFHATGEDLFKVLSSRLKNNDASASNLLFDSGIRGIKYNNTLQVGKKNSKNYTVFSDDDLSIIQPSKSDIKKLEQRAKKLYEKNKDSVTARVISEYLDYIKPSLADKLK